MMRPKDPLTLSPEQFERHVKKWIEASWRGGPMRVVQRAVRKGRSGNYEIDVLVEFEILGGASMRMLVECKRHRRRVQRDVVLALKSKLDELSAHKGMLVSTAGFQSGAIDYAKEHGIALVEIASGRTAYLTKGGPEPTMIPGYIDCVVGWMLVAEGTDQPMWGIVSTSEVDVLRPYLEATSTR
ncbi:MAG: restriction endonuclease [Deltaproteobacteria bacterium]|nr:restriction endonuclease [Deltaproteobacteria bacterium]